MAEGELELFEFVHGSLDGEFRQLPPYVLEWIVPVPPKAPPISVRPPDILQPPLLECEVYRREGRDLVLWARIEK